MPFRMPFDESYNTRPALILARMSSMRKQNLVLSFLDSFASTRSRGKKASEFSLETRQTQAPQARRSAPRPAHATAQTAARALSIVHEPVFHTPKARLKRYP